MIIKPKRRKGRLIIVTDSEEYDLTLYSSKPKYFYVADHADEHIDYLGTELSGCRDEITRLQAEVARLTDEPIEMVLCCPECGEQHIDRIKPEQGWDNPPHKTHLCDYCDHCWRPCDRPTEGVAKTKTLGKIADEDGAIFKTYKYQFDAIKRLTDENAKLKREVDMAEKQSLDFYVEKENAAERDAMREQLRWRHWPEAPTKNGEYLFDHEEIPEKEIVFWIDGEWSVHNTYKTNHRWLPIAQDKGSDG